MNQLISAIAVLAALLFTNSSFAQSGADTLKTATIKVTNVHCDGDMPTIKKRLLNQDGIDEVNFTGRNGVSSVFTVKYHSSVTTQQQIEKQIEATPGCDDKNSTPYRVKKERMHKKDSE